MNEPTCSTSIIVPVTIFPIPSASITAVSPLCQGDFTNINFNGTAGVAANYNWTFGNATIVSGTGSGPYNLQYNTVGNDQISVIVEENGCSDTTSIPVVVSPIPTSTFTVPPAACANEPLAVNYTGNAGAGASYTWDFNGGNIISGSGQGPYSLSWNIGGNYNVSLSITENGCTSQPSSLSVAITDIPVVSISGIAPLCEGSVANASFTGVAGPTAVYQWSFGNATILSGTGAGPYSLEYLTVGNDQVMLTVTENNCTNSDTIDVTVYPIPTSLFTIDNVACINQPVGITFIGNATPAAAYNWIFAVPTSINGSGQGPYSITWNAAGSYQISLVVTENGCISAQTDIFATVNPLPVVVAGADKSACSGIPVPLGDFNTLGWSYQWTPTQDLSNPIISNPTVTIHNNSNAEATRDYYLIVTDANGCINSDTVAVETHPFPVIGFPKNPGQCIDNNAFNFSGFSNLTSGMNYNWMFAGPSNPPTGSQQAVVVSYSAVGTFPVQLTGDYSGCPALPYIDSVTVYEMPAPHFTPLVTEGCRPLIVPFSNLTSGNGNGYNWSFGDGGSAGLSDPTYTYNTAGVYSVSLTASTNHGCTVDTVYNNLISVFADADANFIPSPAIANILAPTIQFQNYSTNVLTYQWDFGDSTFLSNDWSPDHTYGKIGTYDITLMVISADGCVDTVRGTVKVEDNFSFYIPDAFTPNGDGVNDVFRGYGIAIESYTMNIYNRWGELIFKTNNYEHPWDGRLASGPVLTDVYVYRIVLTDLHGLEHTYVGDVSVVY